NVKNPRVVPLPSKIKDATLLEIRRQRHQALSRMPPGNLSAGSIECVEPEFSIGTPLNTDDLALHLEVKSVRRLRIRVPEKAVILLQLFENLFGFLRIRRFQYQERRELAARAG